MENFLSNNNKMKVKNISNGLQLCKKCQLSSSISSTANTKTDLNILKINLGISTTSLAIMGIHCKQFHKWWLLIAITKPKATTWSKSVLMDLIICGKRINKCGEIIQIFVLISIILCLAYRTVSRWWLQRPTTVKWLKFLNEPN